MTLRAVVSSRRMLVLFLLGFSSGLPLFLVASTLQYMMTDKHLAQDAVASVISVGVPYTFKFLWAPAVDRFEVLRIGRRRGWLLVTQIALAGTLLVLAMMDPDVAPAAFYAAAFATAFAAATQDIVVDAYTTDVLEPHELALGSAVNVMGYRTAMLVAGSGALILGQHFGWTVVYVAMAALVGVGVTGTILAEEPPSRGAPRTIDKAVIEAFTELFGRLGWRAALLALGFAVTYKFAEQFAIVVLPSFYRGYIKFTLDEIAVINKAIGYVAIVIGGSIGGVLVAERGLRQTLVGFGILQALTHVAYIAVAIAGHDLIVYAVALAIENMTAAMATSAFVATLIGFCNTRVSATQYALLTSLSGVGGRLFGRFAGDFVDAYGYVGFFTTTIAMAVPGIILAYFAANYAGSARSQASPAEPS
jgi:PAT family beta-lactamase induction signal transducer AmpG